MACLLCNIQYYSAQASSAICYSMRHVCWRKEEIRFVSGRHRVWPERVRIAAGLLQTQPAQSLLAREGIDSRVRPAPRVIPVVSTRPSFRLVSVSDTRSESSFSLCVPLRSPLQFLIA